jgi:hypothetical protein
MKPFFCLLALECNLIENTDLLLMGVVVIGWGSFFVIIYLKFSLFAAGSFSWNSLLLGSAQLLYTGILLLITDLTY